jgi:hypothetical protein
LAGVKTEKPSAMEDKKKTRKRAIRKTAKAEESETEA